MIDLRSNVSAYLNSALPATIHLDEFNFVFLLLLLPVTVPGGATATAGQARHIGSKQEIEKLQPRAATTSAAVAALSFIASSRSQRHNSIYLSLLDAAFTLATSVCVLCGGWSRNQRRAG